MTTKKGTHTPQDAVAQLERVRDVLLKNDRAGVALWAQGLVMSTDTDLLPDYDPEALAWCNKKRDEAFAERDAVKAVNRDLLEALTALLADCLPREGVSRCIDPNGKAAIGARAAIIKAQGGGG